MKFNWNLMEHISSWSMLTMLIILLGENINTIKENKGSPLRG